MDEFTIKRLEKQKKKILEDNPQFQPIQDAIDATMAIIDEKPWTEEQKQTAKAIVMIKVLEMQFEKALGEIKDIQTTLGELDDDKED